MIRKITGRKFGEINEGVKKDTFFCDIEQNVGEIIFSINRFGRKLDGEKLNGVLLREYCNSWKLAELRFWSRKLLKLGLRETNEVA
jgi:hypothetical protein